MLAGHHEADQGDQLGMLAAMGPPESTGRRHGRVAVGEGGEHFVISKNPTVSMFFAF